MAVNDLWFLLVTPKVEVVDDGSGGLAISGWVEFGDTTIIDIGSVPVLPEHVDSVRTYTLSRLREVAHEVSKDYGGEHGVIQLKLNGEYNA